MKAALRAHTPECVVHLSGRQGFRCQRKQATSAKAVQENPQNVDNPEVLPSPELSVQDAVRAQLDALQHNNEPWPNHGILTMYEFAEDVGGLERSRYFGYSKDLYHFDHFLGHFGTQFQDAVDHSGYKIQHVEEEAPEIQHVFALVNGNSGAELPLTFTMKVKDIGRKKGSWMTLHLKRTK